MRATFFALTAVLWSSSFAIAQEDSDSVFDNPPEETPVLEEPAPSDVGGEIERVDKEKAAESDIENPDPAVEGPVESETTTTPDEPAPKPDEPMEAPAEEASPSSETESAAAPTPQEPVKEEPVVEKAPESREESKSTVSTDRYHSDFGSFRLSIGGGRPEFGDNLRYYNDLYGREKIHPDIFFDYYFIDWYVSLGAGLHTRYYRAQGHASRNGTPGAGGVSSDDLDKDSNLELVLIPVQAVALLQITPWKTSFFTINGWAGHEQMYVQESRLGGDVSQGNNDATSSTYVNKGWNQGRVVGASLSLRMDFLEPTASRSLEILGFRSVLITPYVEKVETTKTKIAKFDRTTMGIVFTFESAY